MKFSFALIETQIVETLPELRSAAETYIEAEGKPGEDCGAYIFFGDVFCRYVDVLLDMPVSVGRDRLLARAFWLVDKMLECDDEDVKGLAYIEQLESQSLWFYSRALRFLGPIARRELDQWEPRWRESFNLNAQVQPDMEIIDLYGAREVVLRELKSEGVDRYQVPGITYPLEHQKFVSLEAARDDEDAVVFISCFGTTIPYVMCPPKAVACDELTLLKLSQDLGEIYNLEAKEKSEGQLMFLRIPVGERVWGMKTGNDGRGRYMGELWINDMFARKGLVESVKDVLQGRRDRLLPR